MLCRAASRSLSPSRSAQARAVFAEPVKSPFLPVTPFSSPLRRFIQTSSTPPRIYLYTLSIHGDLYLSSSPHQTVATAYRDPRFLTTFFTRLRRNESEDDEARELRSRGYEFVSVCMGEENYLRPDKDGSGMVYQSLQDGRKFTSELFTLPSPLPLVLSRTDSFRTAELHYGGTLIHPFSPSSLLLHPQTGYLFHPSPVSRRSKTSHYGPHSLLRSSLVLERFAETLEMEESGGGSYEYEGRRWEFGVLKEGDVWQRRDVKD